MKHMIDYAPHEVPTQLIRDREQAEMYAASWGCDALYKTCVSAHEAGYSARVAAHFAYIAQKKRK